MPFVGSYLWKLRQKFGSERLINPGIGVLLINPEGKVWLGKRTDNHQWCHIGGGLEVGDSFKAAASREVREETGLDLPESALVLYNVYSNPENGFYTYPNGHQVHNVGCRFYALTEGIPHVMDDEHSDFQLFSFDNLPHGSNEAILLYQEFLQTQTISVT